MRSKFIAAAATVCVLTSVATNGVADVRIGSAAVAENTVIGHLGKNKRSLKVGDAVYQKERISTGPGANAQLLFNDETALTIGPNSSVVLNELVYDPNKKKGRVVLNAVSGAFQFVTGSARKNAYHIKTPVGTIGIRGTIFSLDVRNKQHNQPTTVLLKLLFGGATLCNVVKECLDLDAGYYAIAGADFITGARVIPTGGQAFFLGSNHPLYITSFGTHPPLTTNPPGNRPPVTNP
jgi:hypothetical protein